MRFVDVSDVMRQQMCDLRCKWEMKRDRPFGGLSIRVEIIPSHQLSDAPPPPLSPPPPPKSLPPLPKPPEKPPLLLPIPPVV